MTGDNINFLFDFEFRICSPPTAEFVIKRTKLVVSIETDEILTTDFFENQTEVLAKFKLDFLRIRFLAQAHFNHGKGFGNEFVPEAEKLIFDFINNFTLVIIAQRIFFG